MKSIHNKVSKLRNKFYIKYFMIKAGNDNPKLKKDVDLLLNKLIKFNFKVSN